MTAASGFCQISDDIALVATCTCRIVIPQPLLHPLDFPRAVYRTRLTRRALGPSQRAARRPSRTQLCRYDAVELAIDRSRTRSEYRVSRAAFSPLRYPDPDVPALGFSSNVTITTTFTDSSSERAFFLLSLFCEMHGPAILRLMSSTLDEMFFADHVALRRIASYLVRIAASIDELRGLMHDATKGPFGFEGREKISPEVFYWEIRPWFNGGKWVYEGVGEAGSGKEMEWGGPSAGQSSLVHAIDLFLGVDHSPRAPRPSTSATEVVHSSADSMNPEGPLPPPASAAAFKRDPTPVALSDSTFMMRMAQYMPSFHRAFLRHLAMLHTPSVSNPSPIPSLRSLAVKYPLELQESYDVAVRAMKLFRDEHMRLATVFIVSQARREPGRDTVFWAGWDEQRLKRAREAGKKEREAMKGTGGTDLVTFLKACRDRTVEAFIESPAGRKA